MGLQSDQSGSRRIILGKSADVADDAAVYAEYTTFTQDEGVKSTSQVEFPATASQRSRLTLFGTLRIASEGSEKSGQVVEV